MGVAADSFDRVEQAERVADVTDQMLVLDGREAGGLNPLHDPLGHPFGDRESH